MTAIAGRTIAEIRTLFDTGEASAVEICRAHLERTRAVDPSVRAYRAVLEQEALVEAARLDRERRDGRAPGALAAVLFAYVVPSRR